MLEGFVDLLCLKSKVMICAVVMGMASMEATIFWICGEDEKVADTLW